LEPLLLGLLEPLLLGLLELLLLGLLEPSPGSPRFPPYKQRCKRPKCQLDLTSSYAYFFLIGRLIKSVWITSNPP
ncbi:MAG: hypothetical protein P9D89_14825, partial [Candidatus Contendobacter sp.]|nr:hypothetical protein [Candidatus Contendobacter sp.]